MRPTLLLLALLAAACGGDKARPAAEPPPAPPPASSGGDEVPDDRPTGPGPVGPGPDGGIHEVEACVKDCVRRNQTQAIPIERIEANCQGECASEK